MTIIQTYIHLHKRGHVIHLESAISDMLISHKTAEKLTLKDFESLVQFAMILKAKHHYTKLCSLIYFYFVDSSPQKTLHDDLEKDSMTSDDVTKDTQMTSSDGDVITRAELIHTVDTLIQFCSQLNTSITHRESILALKGLAQVILGEKLEQNVPAFIECTSGHFNMVSLPIVMYLKELVQKAAFLETLNEEQFTLVLKVFTTQCHSMFEHCLFLQAAERELIHRYCT